MTNRLPEVRFLRSSEFGLVVEFGQTISAEINQQVQALMTKIERSLLVGIIEVIPTYRSLTVYFEPGTVSRKRVTQYIEELLQNPFTPEVPEQIKKKVIKVPVCYGGVMGPDLEYVARYTGLTAREVVELHTQQSYLVYMLGFTPGFPYLGGLSEKLFVPRQTKPRNKVPAGSVGIGGYQTGIYPVESPGEWWLIGRTPLKLFEPQETEPFLFSPGDHLEFYSITVEEYFAMSRKRSGRESEKA